MQSALTVEASVLHTLTVIKAISYFSNVFFLAPAISTFTTSIRICLLFPFHPQWLGENKTKKKQPNLFICKTYCSLCMIRSFWESSSSLQAEDFRKEVCSSWDPSNSFYTLFPLNSFCFTTFMCMCLSVCACATVKSHIAKARHSLSMTSQRQEYQLNPVCRSVGIPALGAWSSSWSLCLNCSCQ